MNNADEDFKDLISEVEIEFGITARDVTRLGGEVDFNVRVECTDGRVVLIKATEALPRTDIAWQGRLLDHLALNDSWIPVPRVLRTRSGQAEISAKFNVRELCVRVLTWLDGEAIGRADGVDFQLLSEVGTIAGRMFNCLQTADRTGVPITHHWDVRQSREAIGTCIDFIKDPMHLTAVEAILRKCEPVESHLPILPAGLVHQDLNDFNVLVAQGRNQRLQVTGIIDFSDTLDSVRVAEVIVAGAYAMLRQQDPVEALSALVAGFHSVVPLTELELAVIFPFASARLCVNACTWTQRTLIDPGPYGVSRMLHTWPAIQLVAPISSKEALARIEIACGSAGRADQRPK